MNLRKINLNLLVILDVLLDEKNVSYAAQKLFRTQSAISTSLNQLREIFNDELLIRLPKGMQPTNFAEKLHPELKKTLGHINIFINDQQEFDYRSSNRTFILGVNQTTEHFLVPALYKSVNENAPKINLQFKSASLGIDNDFFCKHSLDLVITAKFHTLPAQLCCERLFNDDFVYLTRKQNAKIKKQITIDIFNKTPLISGENFNHILRTYSLLPKQSGIKLKKTLIVPGLFTALEMVSNGDFAIILPKKIALQVSKNYNLDINNLPFTTPKLQIVQIWPRAFSGDKGLIWLQNLIRDTY